MSSNADPMHGLRPSGAPTNPAPLLWPARLDHVALGSPDPESLARFYADHLDFTVARHDADEIALTGPNRRVVIAAGPPRQLRYAAFDLGDPARVARYRAALERQDIATADLASPFLAAGAFTVADPDGNRFAFGAACQTPPATGRPGRLQHVVVASRDAERIATFAANQLGFRVTDWVRDESKSGTACFLRTDEEHHSFAVFRAPAARLDHFSLETDRWDDIRDWADHFARTEVPIFWGPGRHGPGNNLFIMVNDPDGNAIEFSAEITHHPYPMPPGAWPHAPRTLNLWGSAIMRS